MIAIQKAIGVAFKELRQAGFLARQNYQCCSSCAGVQWSKDLAMMSIEDRAKVRGAIYYHTQDGEVLKKSSEASWWRSSHWSVECGYLNEIRPLSIRHGQVWLDSEPYGIEPKDIARAAVDALRRQQLRVSWSGDVQECVKIFGFLQPSVQEEDFGPLTQ